MDRLKTASNAPLYISVYSRYYSICVHRSVLEAIGNPRFIHLGIDEQTTGFMVLGRWYSQQRAIRVQLSNGSFIVRSKALIEELTSVSGLMKEPGTYRMKGILMPNENAVVFPLKSMQLLGTPKLKKLEEYVDCSEVRC